MTRKKPSKTALRAKADRLFSLRVRARGVCEAAFYTKVRCNGNLQCAHLISRRYLRIRWSEENALSLCMAHHVYFTHHELEWQLWLSETFPGRWERLRDQALEAGPKPDYDLILERLAS